MRPDYLEPPDYSWADTRSLFKYAPALQPACERLRKGPVFDPQIPDAEKARIIQLLRPAAMQTGAIHALQEVETWLRDNHLKIVKEDECVSQSLEPEAPSGDTS